MEQGAVANDDYLEGGHSGDAVLPSLSPSAHERRSQSSEGGPEDNQIPGVARDNHLCQGGAHTPVRGKGAARAPLHTVPHLRGKLVTVKVDTASTFFAASLFLSIPLVPFPIGQSSTQPSWGLYLLHQLLDVG